MKGDTDNSWLP